MVKEEKAIQLVATLVVVLAFLIVGPLLSILDMHRIHAHIEDTADKRNTATNPLTLPPHFKTHLCTF